MLIEAAMLLETCSMMNICFILCLRELLWFHFITVTVPEPYLITVPVPLRQKSSGPGSATLILMWIKSVVSPSPSRRQRWRRAGRRWRRPPEVLDWTRSRSGRSAGPPAPSRGTSRPPQMLGQCFGSFRYPLWILGDSFLDPVGTIFWSGRIHFWIRWDPFLDPMGYIFGSGGIHFWILRDPFWDPKFKAQNAVIYKNVVKSDIFYQFINLIKTKCWCFSQENV